MKVLFVVFGKYLPASYVSNLFYSMQVAAARGFQIKSLFFNADMSYDTFNEFMMNDGKMWLESVDYDMLFVTNDSVMPHQDSFDKVFYFDYPVYTFTNEDESDAIPTIKTDDSVPLNCFVVKKGVLESISERPIIQPSVSSFTDGFMGSIKENVTVINDIKVMMFK